MSKDKKQQQPEAPPPKTEKTEEAAEDIITSSNIPSSEGGLSGAPWWMWIIPIVLILAFMTKGQLGEIGFGKSTSDNQPLPGSTNETALTLPSGNQLMSLSALGIQNWKQQKFAYFWLQPGESAPVLNPEETRGCCGPYTFRVRPSEQITQRHRLPTLKWSDWYIADPSGYVATPKGKSVTIPASVCGLQWRNQTDHPIMIGIGFRR